MDKDHGMGGEDKHSPPLEELATDNRKLLEGSPVDHAERGDRGRCIDIQAFREIMYALHAVSIGTHQLLYFSAMKYAKNYLETEAADMEDAVEQLADIFDAENLGTLSLRSYDDGRNAEIELGENALTINADTDKPICYFISGYIAGFLENALDGRYVVNETSCTAQGRQTCVFKVQKR